MDRAHFYSIMNGEGTLDYEIYLNTKALLSCQKDFKDFCNPDELQFQIVHQVEEMWMKLIGYTLLDIDDYLQKQDSNRVITLFRRVQLGNGSGQESPGFRSLLKMHPHIWQSFKACYLDKWNLTVEQIYNSKYSHSDAYVLAEALAEYDELFQRFRFVHLQLIQRSIGLGSQSLKGRSVELLNEGLRTRFFPELWEIRHQMTDSWGAQYGRVRDPIGGH